MFLVTIVFIITHKGPAICFVYQYVKGIDNRIAIVTDIITYFFNAACNMHFILFLQYTLHHLANSG